MADQLQLRRGTTAENLAFTGAQGEVTIDTDKHAVVVHDGVTAGGFPQASEQALNNFTIFFDDDTGGGSVADAYQLTAKDDTLIPDQYNDGQYFGFVTTNTNTGPSTADFAGLGQKNIKYADGTDPAAGDISGRVTMIYDEANDWLELQRKYTGTETTTRTDVRQTVNSGPVDANGRASFIIAGSGLQAIASGLSSSNRLNLSYGNGFGPGGVSDIIVELDTNQVFGGLVDNDVNYLYLDYDTGTETITPGSTILEPVYSYAKPSSPATGQYWYPMDHRSSGEYWDGAAWQPVLRIFIGQVTTSAGSVASVVSYAYQGRYNSGVVTLAANAQTVSAHNIGTEVDFEVFIRKDENFNWLKCALGLTVQASASDPNSRLGVTAAHNALNMVIKTTSNVLTNVSSYGVGAGGAEATDAAITAPEAYIVVKRGF